jgi:hypothetical protein
VVVSGPHSDSDQPVQLHWGDRRIAIFSITVTTQVKEGQKNLIRSQIQLQCECSPGNSYFRRQQPVCTKLAACYYGAGSERQFDEYRNL